jgi:hypothetical protein
MVTLAEGSLQASARKTISPERLAQITSHRGS